MIGGRYSLDHKIGRGGMGSVWLGRDEVLGRPVAIKRVGVMPGGSSPDLLRAEREARIAASLNHPHVVGVFDLVHDDEGQWLVMEYVAGTTLAERVQQRGALPASEAAPLLAQAAQALMAAHAAGIVHRDVKPSNILVRDDGEVKLSDFGIARAESDAALTQTGLVTGSPAYLAPEIASGRPASPASDVWSLGATAFHALSGHPPYDVGDNVLGTLYQIVNEPPPRLADAGTMAPLLEGTMVTDPAKRWSMAEVARFLEQTAAPGAATSTRVAPSVALPVPREAPATPAPRPADEPVVLAPEPAAGRRRDRPRRGRLLPAVVAVLMVALVAAVVVLATRHDAQHNGDGAAPVGAASGTRSSPSSPTTRATPQPDAKDMVTFVTSYLQLADQDPTTAFGSLTPAYQKASGGLSGYLSFWGDVSGVRLDGPVRADPAALTASYTYSYVKPGKGKQTDTVTLDLSFDGSAYLIAGAG